jgi:chromosome segregation ATPase
VIALAGVIVWAAVKTVERRRLANELEGLRDQLSALRNEAANCQSALVDEEATLHQFTAQVDSLHTALSSYQESNGGVPQARYDEYLRALEGYKAAFADWESRSDSLHAHLNGCQELARQHNHIADSIQSRIDAVQGSR